MSSSESAPALVLFSGEPQHELFPRLADILPTTTMKAPPSAHEFPKGESLEMPTGFDFEGTHRSAAGFLESTDTAALLVLKDGTIRHEQYFLTGGRDVHWISWSVAKSFVSAMIGIAIEEGDIGSIEDPIDRYVPALTGSAYEGVRIRDVLQMSSGVRWNEDYSDPNSEINRFGAVLNGKSTFDAFLAGMVRETDPGSLCQYNSADTQALGNLLTSATGRGLADYMEEKLCRPLGFEFPGYWLTDSAGREMAFGGLNLTARDFAKIGELFRNNGVWSGQQIVPEGWVRASTVPDGPHVMPGKVLVGGHVLPLGYGFQWWLPEGDRGEFSAIGIYNQFVFVDPSRGVVIVKLSANRSYGVSEQEADNQEMETVEFLRAVARCAE